MKFEDLDMRVLAQKHYLSLDAIMKDSKEYYLKDQILRAALSISNNIAEWGERWYKQDLIRFLYIAKWSCAEVRNMLHLLKSKSLISEEIFNDLYKENTLIGLSISRYISAIIKSKKD